MFNQINIIGNVGKEPELRYTPDGKEVCSFSVATSERYTSNGQKVEKTTWFEVSFWGNQAKFANDWLGKGSKVFVTGTLSLDEWEHDGKQYHKLKISGRNFVNLTPKGESSNNEVTEDEIPF